MIYDLVTQLRQGGPKQEDVLGSLKLDNQGPEAGQVLVYSTDPWREARVVPDEAGRPQVRIRPIGTEFMTTQAEVVVEPIETPAQPQPA